MRQRPPEYLPRTEITSDGLATLELLRSMYGELLLLHEGDEAYVQAYLRDVIQHVILLRWLKEHGNDGR